MRIALCEDDKREREQFLNALREWDATLSAEHFADGQSFLEAAGTAPPFDIVFLDIYLQEENGVEIARELRKISPGTGIVFVTNSTEHAVDAFSLYALHYLVKPVAGEGIAEAFRRLGQISARRRSVLHFTVGRDSRIIYQDEIYYVENFSHTAEIHVAGDEVIKLRMPIYELEQKLDGNFLKINRGTLVNMEYIEQMSSGTCILQSGVRLAVAGRRYNAIQAAYDDFLFSRLSERQVWE